MSLPGKIDVHHHALPGFYTKVVEKTGDVSGAPAPQTSIEGSLQLMDKLDIATAIISLSAPGAESADTIEGARTLARQYNEYGADFRQSNPSRLGFFGALPSLNNDLEGAVAELKYVLDEKKADGITLFTSYGDKYLGHPFFKPLWEELNERSAVVFVHPTHSPTGSWTGPDLPQPTIDYPHETTRTVSNLILSGRKRQNPNCKIILSHAGGTLPFLVERLAQLSSTIFVRAQVEGAPLGDEIIADAKTFYFDTALAGSANILDTLLKWAPHDRILFGTDFPYAFFETIQYYTKGLGEYEMDRKARDAIYEGNALTLFPRLRK